METSWLLLTYRIPDGASRKRACVWYDVKSIGALPWGKGRWVVPERPETTSALQAITSRAREFGGEASVDRVHLDPARADDLIGRSRAARATDFAEIARQADNLLETIRLRTSREDFTFSALQAVEAELAKLSRWAAQVRARDYFGGSEEHTVADVLRRCDEAAAAFLEDVARREEPPS